MAEQKVIPAADPATTTLTASDVQTGAKRIKVNWISGHTVLVGSNLEMTIAQGTRLVQGQLTQTKQLSWSPPLEFLIADGDVTITLNSSVAENATGIVDYYGV
jgi:hypothetical protein